MTTLKELLAQDTLVAYIMSWLMEQSFPNYEVHQRIGSLVFQGRRTQETKLTLSFFLSKNNADGSIHAMRGQDLIGALYIKEQSIVIASNVYKSKPASSEEVHAADPDAFERIYDWVRSML